MELTQGQISEIISNIYLCGINNNKTVRLSVSFCVVICLKISTFVVSTTTLEAGRRLLLPL